MMEISTILDGLYRRYRRDEFLGFHSYRYLYFVRTSPRGRHCRYAAACIKLYKMDNEGPELLQFLEALEPSPPSLPRLRELLDENQDRK